MIKPKKDTDLYRLRTAIFLFVYSLVALIFSQPIIQLFRVRAETQIELIAIVLLIIPRFLGYLYFSYCGLIDIKRIERRKRVFNLSMLVFATYLLLSGALTVYHYFIHPDQLIIARAFDVPIAFAEKTRIGLSRLAFTLNSFILAGIFIYNIVRFNIKGFTPENQLRMMCSILIAIGMTNVLVVSFIYTPLVGFLALFLALWTKEKGYRMAFFQSILLALTSAGIGSGVFLLRDLFSPAGMEQVFFYTMLAALLIGVSSLIGYIYSRRVFYAKLAGKNYHKPR